MPANRVELVDTVGAGDSFIAASLFQLDRMGLLSVATLDRLEIAETKEAIGFAVRAAAVTCGRVGSDPPHLEDLEPAAAPSTPA